MLPWRPGIPLGWVFFVVQLTIVAVSWIYFFTPPIVFSALVAACVGAPAWLARRAG